MINEFFAEALRVAVTQWRALQTLQQVIDQLRDPKTLALSLLPFVDEVLHKHNLTRADVKEAAWARPYFHLRGVFQPGSLPDTPIDFCPVPDVEGVLLAKVTAIVFLAVIDSDTVSYGSENQGELFVNLVVIPGKGTFAEKSTRHMSGHTDGVSFPIRGQLDPQNSRIAPSPDFVCLSALRNPEKVTTRVMPLETLIASLSDEHIQELQKPQYVVGSQLTFRDGMEEILGQELIVDDAQLLYAMQGKWWIRFSHKTTSPVEHAQSCAKEAMDALKEACLQCAIPLSLAPGDIALVNNRIALHGRSEVGQEYGRETRWLLRTYGLDTSELDQAQRSGNSPFMLFP